MSKFLYDTLAEFGWVQDPVVRKQVAVLLDGEGVTEPALRKRLLYLRRPPALLSVLNPKRKVRDNYERNQPRAEDSRDWAKAELDYVRERVLMDGLEPQTVAAQMGWPVSRVLEVVEGVGA